MNYNNLFKSIYKSCKNKDISFFNSITKDNVSLIISHYKLDNLFKKLYKPNLLKQFINYLFIQKDKEKHLLIIPHKHKLSIERKDVKLVQENIYDGFMYLNKEKYLLYDNSLKSKLHNMKKLYMERNMNEF